jgi:hypothetical protein
MGTPQRRSETRAAVFPRGGRLLLQPLNGGPRETVRNRAAADPVRAE